jgi:ribonuclease HI
VNLGIKVWRHRWRAKAWYSSAQQVKEIDHADLWQRVDNLLACRSPSDFEITWVKGHALPRHINRQMTTEMDIWGNNEADRIAGRASALAVCIMDQGG